jgi:hypothetical protein
MRKVSCLFLIAASLFLGSAAIAQQGTAKSTAPKPPTARIAGKPVPGGPFRVVATVKDLMDAMLDPAGDFIFDAVATTVTPAGTVEKAPKNDAEWAVVRSNALILIEGANLLMMPGRHIAPGSEKPLARGQAVPTPAELGGELDPIAIEARVRVDFPNWVRLARGLQVAAAAALKAADAKDVHGLLASGDMIDEACEACHLRYWYPDQLKLLEKADRLLRERHKP